MEELTVDTLIVKIKGQDDKVRTAAWQAAGKLGAEALRPLAGVVLDGPLEAARAANHAMWQIVRYSGRPDADGERRAASVALLRLLQEEQFPLQLRRDMIWMLSEIVDDAAIEPNAASRFLEHPELREDVRAGLQRVGGPNAISALKFGLESAPDDFKPSIAAGLRALGVRVPGVPDLKLKPTRATSVTPIGR